MKRAILCVDDEQFVLASLKRELENKFGNDYLIEASTSAEDALQIVHDLNNSDFLIPVIIVDYIMPVMKGDELLEKISSISPDTKGIMLTGQATTDGIKNAINKASLYRFLTKPWNQEDIILTVQEAIKSFDLKIALDEKMIELESLNKKLLQLDNSKNYFLNLLSHEINTPLNSISGFSHLLKQSVNNSEHIEYCDLILTSIERLRKFSDYSLMITRLINEKYDVKIMNQNIYSLLDISLIKLRKKILFKDLKLEKKLIYESFFLRIDPKLIEMILEIILHNAIRFSPENGTITISDLKENNTYKLTFSDNGPGFSKETIENLYQFFISDDITHHGEGFGLGLAMAKIIMDVHNAQIITQNKINGGSEVSLIFGLK